MLNLPQGSIMGHGMLSTAADSMHHIDNNSDLCSNLSGSISRFDDEGFCNNKSRNSPRGYQIYSNTQYDDMFNLENTRKSFQKTNDQKPPKPLKIFNVQEYMEKKPKNVRETLRSSIQSYKIEEMEIEDCKHSASQYIQETVYLRKPTQICSKMILPEYLVSDEKRGARTTSQLATPMTQTSKFSTLNAEMRSSSL